MGDRALAVFQWLVEVGGVNPSQLRMTGRTNPSGYGMHVSFKPIQELVATEYDSNTGSSKTIGSMKEVDLKCASLGLRFEARNAQVSARMTDMLAEVARWLQMEEGKCIWIEGHCD